VNLVDQAAWREPLRAGAAWILRGVRRDVVVLSGAFDLSSTGVLRAELLDAVADATDVLTVDVQDVTVLDASTVHVLLEARHAGAESGLGVRLSGASGVVARVLTICGIGPDLVVKPTPDHRSGFERLGTLGSAAPNVPAEWRDPHWLISPPGPAIRDPEPGVASDRPLLSARRRNSHVYRRIGGVQRQRADDARVRTVRRTLLTRFRGRLGADPLALADDRFLAAADRFVILRAIIVAALVVGGADRCDLQVYDPKTRSLTIAQQHGLTAQFLDYFVTVEGGAATSAGTAMATGQPVLIDDVTRSPIFASRAGLEVMLASGIRAVRSYPLWDDGGRLLGVLSFHYRSPRPRHGNPELVAYSAALALAQA
jgi:anti-anti-sigma factor